MNIMIVGMIAVLISERSEDVNNKLSKNWAIVSTISYYNFKRILKSGGIFRKEDRKAQREGEFRF